MPESLVEKESEHTVFQEMDSFLWPTPEFDRKVDINKSNGSQPEVIGKGADFESEQE
jgi:hypothetical protein